MTDYTKLVKALTCGNDGKLPCHNNECPYWVDKWHGIGLCNVIKKDADAADAIEALQAQLPKQGAWLIHSTGGSMATKKCPFCGSESWQSKEYTKVPKYCGNCGAHLPAFDIVDWVDYLYAKTEAQDDKV